MRRLLAYGCLVLGPAALYVLDEPFAGVDADGRTRVLQSLLEARQRGVGILLAAHDRDADDVARLEPERFDLVRAEEVEA